MSDSLPVVILISGHGSNLQAIIDAQQSGELNIDIRAVISNKAGVYGLTRAKQAGIKTDVIPHKNFESREAFDKTLQQAIDTYEPKLIVLAGFMRRLGKHIVTHFKDQIINIHPSLLPKYPGLNTHQKVIDHQDKEHGVSIHLVTEDLDSGPVISQAKLNVLPEDTVSSLKTRIHTLEHIMYPKTLRWFVEKRINIQNGEVLLNNTPLPRTGFLLELN